MREFAIATVLQVEQFFRLPRAKWEDTSEEFADDAVVRFYLEGPETSGSFLYHAMVDLGGGATSEPIFFGSPSEVSAEWLDAAQIRMHFKATVEEFRAAGFLDAYFADEE